MVTGEFAFIWFDYIVVNIADGVLAGRTLSSPASVCRWASLSSFSSRRLKVRFLFFQVIIILVYTRSHPSVASNTLEQNNPIQKLTRSNEKKVSPSKKWTNYSASPPQTPKQATSNEQSRRAASEPIPEAEMETAKRALTGSTLSGCSLFRLCLSLFFSLLDVLFGLWPSRPWPCYMEIPCYLRVG